MRLSQGIAEWFEKKPRQTTLSSWEYSFKDLHEATDGFSSSKRLGSGTSSVYKGMLKGSQVAVKAVRDSGEDFQEEVRILSRFRHPNLVRLLGWSKQKDFLVYELLCGGDLHYHLERSRSGEVFPASRRRLAAYQAACGLSYMMNSEPKAFHRDIKPANILFDSHGTAKMADFGLAGTIKDNKAHLTVDRISGTPGYACPIYIQSGQVSEQTEVYSFGTVLLELMVNLAPALMDDKGGLVYPLLQCVQPAAPGALSRVFTHVEPTAGWTALELEELGKLALRCVSFTPELRPLFDEILQGLRPDEEIKRVALEDPFSKETGPRQEPESSKPPGEDNLDTAGAQRFEGNIIFSEETVSHSHDARLVFKADSSSEWEASVGRQHQPEFFERLVKKESLPMISRTHFKIGKSRVSPSGVGICKLSGNPLLLDGAPLRQGLLTPIEDNAALTFGALSDPALVLRLRLHSKQKGPERLAPVQSVHVEQPQRGTVAATAVLECVKSICTDVKRLPQEAKRIDLLKDHTMEVGRQHQVALFDKLLQANASWLTFISRTHLKVCLGTESLQVENLSCNPVMVNGRPLKKSQRGKIFPGDCLAFLAKSGREKETFLEFSLHIDKNEQTQCMMQMMQARNNH